MPVLTRTPSRFSATTLVRACRMRHPIWQAQSHSILGQCQGKMGGYKNDKVDKLIAEALGKAADDPARVDLAQKAQAHLP